MKKCNLITVAQLKAMLHELPPDIPVLISTDPEGNAVAFPGWIEQVDGESSRPFAALIWPMHTEHGRYRDELAEWLPEFNDQAARWPYPKRK